MDKTSISVPTLQRMLGLKKGAAYWLIKQGHFEIIIVGKKMRVMLDSFEEWYASQFHYKKVNGPAPGRKYANTLSASEAGAVLGMEGSRLYEFLKTEPFDIVWVDDHPRIDKHSLEEWMAQRAILETTYSATEVASMLDVHRNTVYNLIAKGLFKTERYNDRPRIDKESFEAWYQSQKRYLKANTRKEV